MSDAVVGTAAAPRVNGTAAVRHVGEAEAAAWREHGWALGPGGVGLLVAAVLAVSVLCGLSGLG